MRATAAARSTLVLRPYLGITLRDAAFAHVEGVVMRARGPGLPSLHGELDPIGWGECGRTPRHERFRLASQVDDRGPEAYAIRWGYAAANRGEVFTAADLAWAGASLRRLAAGLDRLAACEGPADDLAGTALRLARVLRVEAIAVLAVPGPGEGSRPSLPVLAAGTPTDPGPVPAAIRAVVARLHADCARRLGRAVA